MKKKRGKKKPAKKRPPTLAAQAVNRLTRARKEYDAVPAPGARDLPILEDLSPNGTSIRPIENVKVDATRFIQESGRVFRYGNSTVFEKDRGADGKLIELAIGLRVEPGAHAVLGNLFSCRYQPNNVFKQYAPPAKLADMMMAHEPLLAQLSVIKTYARRPVFDENFNFCGPGWREASGVMVHSKPITPCQLHRPASGSNGALSRLPPRLAELLTEFCFRTDADLVNFVGVLLTGVLSNHFVTGGKPVVLIDGNQPSLGKTLLAGLVSTILDGKLPTSIPYTADEEELNKKVVAQLRGGNASAIALDNAKTRHGAELNSPFLEAVSTHPVISLRILGRSENFERPNNVLWMVTMNRTRASRDLVSRSVPCRLRYEGNPDERQLKRNDLLEFALANRGEILGELFGMIQRWLAKGKPSSNANHRFRSWAQKIGGILEANGFSEFLTNVEEAAAEFDDSLEALAAIAEQYRRKGFHPMPAKQMVALFQAAGVLVDRLEESKSSRGKSVLIGNFLSPLVNRTCTTEIDGVVCRATLRSKQGRANTTEYFFEFDEQAPPDGRSQAADQTQKMTCKKRHRSKHHRHAR